MGRRGDKRSHSRRRSRSPQRRRTSDSGRRRSRSTSRSSERFPSRRRRSYSRSSSRGRSRRHRARRSASPSPSRSSRNRRRSRSRSNSHSRSRRGRSRTRSRNRSRSGSYSRSRRSPSPRRESRHRSPSVHRDGRTENRRQIRQEDTREDRWGDRREDKREDRQGDHRGDTPDSRHAPLREHQASPTIVDQHKPHKETSPIFQDKAKTPNEPTRLTDHPLPNCVVEESKPHPPEETKRSAQNDRQGDRPPVSTPNSVDSTPASTPLSYQRAVVSVPEDPVAKKRRAVREEAHRAYMKSSLVRAQAVAKFHAADTNVRMAETWLEFVDKTLEDVGRRIELQDWKFKKLEQGGMDLHELLEAPVLHDREPE